MSFLFAFKILRYFVNPKLQMYISDYTSCKSVIQFRVCFCIVFTQHKIQNNNAYMKDIRNTLLIFFSMYMLMYQTSD